MATHLPPTDTFSCVTTSGDGELGHVTPIEFETDHYRTMNTQQQRLPGEPSLY